MNVSEAMLIATWCAATGTVPIRPISRPTAPKAVYSRNVMPPIGRPIRSMRPSAGGDIVSLRHGTSAGRTSRQAKASSRIGMDQRPIVVEIALPATPSAGKPRCP